MGVLAGIEDGDRLRPTPDCEYFVGTSAGSIVAARLVVRPAAAGAHRRSARISTRCRAHRSPRTGWPPPASPPRAAPASGRSPSARRSRRWPSAWPPPAARWRGPCSCARRRGPSRRWTTCNGPRAPRAPASTADCGSPPSTAATGRRVVFGEPRRAEARRVADAVAASCTVPWMFAPVTIGGREYVDGGVWSPTNLDAAPAGRDTHVLCLNPTADLRGTPSDVLTLMRSASRSSAVSVEALALRRRGAAVQADRAERATAPRRWAPTSWTASRGLGSSPPATGRDSRWPSLTGCCTGCSRTRLSRRVPAASAVTLAPAHRVRERAYVRARAPPRGCRSRHPGPNRSRRPPRAPPRSRRARPGRL